jgi:deoxyhypusine synthase
MDPSQPFLANDLKTVDVALKAVLVQSVSMPESAVHVSGYDFNKGVDYKALLESYATSGFQATAIGQAIKEINNMVRSKRCMMSLLDHLVALDMITSVD